MLFSQLLTRNPCNSTRQMQSKKTPRTATTSTLLKPSWRLIPGIIPSQGLPHLPHAPGEHKQNISRRTVVASLTGLAVVGISGGAITWLVRTHRHTTPATTPPPTPDRSPTPTPTPIGTTFHTYRGHHNIVDCVAWSPNGTLIASASSDKTVQVWDVDTGGVNVSNDTRPTDIVTAVGWSADNKLPISATTY